MSRWICRIFCSVFEVFYFAHLRLSHVSQGSVVLRDITAPSTSKLHILFEFICCFLTFRKERQSAKQHLFINTSLGLVMGMSSARGA